MKLEDAPFEDIVASKDSLGKISHVQTTGWQNNQQTMCARSLLLYVAKNGQKDPFVVLTSR